MHVGQRHYGLVALLGGNFQKTAASGADMAFQRPGEGIGENEYVNMIIR